MGGSFQLERKLRLRGCSTPSISRISGSRFLDKGVKFNILPCSSGLPSSGQGMVGPTGSHIRCWWECQVQLNLSGQFFTWTFLQASEVQMAILGLDFLKANCLSLDLKGSKLVHAGSCLIFHTITSGSKATASVIQSRMATTTPAFPVSRKLAALPTSAGPVLCRQAALSTSGPALSGQVVPVISP